MELHILLQQLQRKVFYTHKENETLFNLTTCLPNASTV